MSKSKGGGSLGARRGGQQEATMNLSQAKSMQGKKGSKPNLDSAPKAKASKRAK